MEVFIWIFIIGVFIAGVLGWGTYEILKGFDDR